MTGYGANHLPLLVLSTSTLTNEGTYSYQRLVLTQARELIADFSEFVSAVGHESTAQLLTDVLGVPIDVNRIPVEMTPGQMALVFKIRGRRPDGGELDYSAVMADGWDLYLLHRIDTGPPV